MPKKRKNRGRKLGGSGHERTVQCSQCGRVIPADKAVKVTRWTSPVGGSLGKDLERQGAYVSKRLETRYYCVSCAVYLGIVRPRAEEERKEALPINRPLARRQVSNLPLKFLKV
ncbi:MAG: 30S ribosomal protein S26e [Candidatus Korarchaeum sp.]